MEKAKKSEDSLMKVIIKLFKNSRRVIFLTLLVIVASVVMTLFPPLVLEQRQLPSGIWGCWRCQVFWNPYRM